MVRRSMLLSWLAGCSSLLAPGPEMVVRTYFEAVSAEQTERVQAQVSATCAGKSISRGAPGKVLFVPVQYERLDIAVLSQDSQTARVAYSYAGVASGQKVDEKVEVLGAEIELKLDGLEVGRVERSGEFSLLFEDGAWKIGCS